MTAPRVMLATLVDAPFDDAGWIFETKWDGVRAICRIDARGRVTLRSRTGHDLLAAFPELRALSGALRGRPLTADGEIVTLDPRGRSSFKRLQVRLGRRDPSREEIAATPVRYVVFDLLEHEGRDLTALPLARRRALLERAVRERPGLVAVSRAVRGSGRAAFAAAVKSGLEGIVGKRLDAPYVARRSRNWVKVKARSEQEFVVGGWTDPRGSREAFGALLLGVYDARTLRYVGAVGTGFDARTIHEIAERLRSMPRASSPFAAPPRLHGAHWVEPRLVAEVSFAEWTRGGSIRQPVFLGLRQDKAARGVTRERAASAP